MKPEYSSGDVSHIVCHETSPSLRVDITPFIKIYKSITFGPVKGNTHSNSVISVITNGDSNSFIVIYGSKYSTVKDAITRKRSRSRIKRRSSRTIPNQQLLDTLPNQNIQREDENHKSGSDNSEYKSKFNSNINNCINNINNNQIKQDSVLGHLKIDQFNY
ncbi:hypothetical protein ACTFIZ_006604 [Dictyostelium cf. discoideum]